MKKVLFSVVVVFVVCTEVTGLKCYICDSELHGSACYDPINTDEIKSTDCKYTNSYQKSSGVPSVVETFDFRQPQKQQKMDSNSEKYSTDDYECVQFERMFSRYNKRRFVRRCLPRNLNPNFCAELQQLGNYQGYSLTKCNVCYSDYCNSSGNLKLSLALNLLFFYIFYRCTNF